MRLLLAVLALSWTLGCVSPTSAHRETGTGKTSLPAHADDDGGLDDATSAGQPVDTTETGADEIADTESVADAGGIDDAGGVVETGGIAGAVDADGAGGVIGTGGVGESSSLAGCALVMHMDEASWSGSADDVVDSCGQNNGTAVMGLGPSDALPTTTSAGYFGGAGLFDDRNGCVEVADDPSLRPTSQLTLSAWIYPTAFDPGSNGVVAKRIDYMNCSSYTMFLWAADGLTYQLWADIGADRFHGKQAFVVNSWYHIAVVFDGSLPASQRVRLYVDGALDGELSEDAGTIPSFPSPLYVGCLPLSGPAQEFAGKIDEVAVWTRALGASEILQIYLAKISL